VGLRSGRQHFGEAAPVWIQSPSMKRQCSIWAATNSELQSQVPGLTTKLRNVCLQKEIREFLHFPNLPPKLRRKIRRYSLPGPRVLNFDFVCWTPRQQPRFQANCGPPSLLHSCRESREVAPERYEPMFHSKEALAPAFYFDITRDTLCFTMETSPIKTVLFFGAMPMAIDVRRVRYLSVASELPKELMKYITQFHGLEVFSLILSTARYML
jgi:hypothetical protein